MEKTNVSEVLRALATGDKNRSETARLTDIFEEVQAAIDAGVSRSAILEALHGQGFTMTPKAFESALYRIRKRRIRSVKNEGSAIPASSSSTAPNQPERTAPKKTSLQPTSNKGPLDAKALLGDLAKPDGPGHNPIPKESSFEIDDQEKPKK